MKAMILAAGLGTRLRPLTDTTPKALMEVDGRTVLQIVAERLIGAGVTDIVVNVHHHASQMRQAIQALARPGVRFHISDESDRLLDTGGGLLHARALLEGDAPFFLYNIDILSGIRLEALYAAHLRSDALATLAVSDRPTNRFFLWDGELLVGWENTDTRELVRCQPTANPPTGSTSHEGAAKRPSPLQHHDTAHAGNTSHERAAKRPSPLQHHDTAHAGSTADDGQGSAQGQAAHRFRRRAFSGIAVISPQIFQLLDERGAFSIKDVYLRLAGQWPVRCFPHDHRSWFDIGTPEKLALARKNYRLTLEGGTQGLRD